MAWISSLCFATQTFFILTAWFKNIHLFNMHIPAPDFLLALCVLGILLFGECIQMFKHKIAIGYDVSDHPLARTIGIYTGMMWIIFALFLLGGFQSEVTDRLLGEYLRVFVLFLIVFNISVIVSNIRRDNPSAAGGM